jgi:hypothetical protein
MLALSPLRHLKKQFILLLFCPLFVLGQNSSTPFFTPATQYDSNRGNIVLITEGLMFTTAIWGLNYLWYKKYARSKFHFFNDNKEWLQMDKMGHAVTAYNLGILGIDALQWTGMDRQQAIWYGGLTGLLFLSTIEVLDGFSTDWGFSRGDMLANVSGSALAIGQQLAWNEQRFQLKFSYHQSIYAAYAPNKLGVNFIQRMLKDYNGQTYWLSGNIYAFLKKDAEFPRWLNLAVGYGAEGLLGARENQTSWNGKENPVFARSRRFFLAADADLSKIPSNNRALNFILPTINFIKTPAPALEFKGVKKSFAFHPLYF